MSNKLITLDSKIPIKAIPEQTRKKYLETDFAIWVSNLLGLNGEDSAKRLILALPAIEKHFWSLGVDEIVKAFTMYADGQLKTQPLTNFLDRILVGKIFKEYREQKPVLKKEIKEPEITNEEKDLIVYSGVLNCFEEFKQTNIITSGYVWVYDHLDELNILNYSNEDKRNQLPIAEKRLVRENKEFMSVSEYKKFTNDLENKRQEQAIVNTAKKMLLERYFLKLTAKNKHIKDIL